MSNIKILGTGMGIPKRKIDNDFFEKTVNKDDEWIYKKTGIKSRYIIENNEEYINIITESINEALRNSKINKNNIDLVILATSTPTNLFGGVSRIINNLEINNCISFDITLACNGFNISLYTAYQYLKDSNYKNALIIGADCLSRWVDWSDYKTSILFGDGVGSIIIGKTTNIDFGLIDYFHKQDSSKHNILSIEVKEQEYFINNIKVMNNIYDFMFMNGRDVSKFVIETIPKFIIDSLNKINLQISDIKYIIPHQANKRILDKIAKELNIDHNIILSNIEKYGNTSSASIPILLHEIIQENKLAEGDLILFLGFGAGMSSSIILFKYF